MIDYLIFNKQKWFEGQSQNYIGKRVTTDARVNSYNANASGFANIGTTTIFAGATVKAQSVSNGQTYLNASYSSNLVNGWFNLTEFFKNGGVWRSLLSQGFRYLKGGAVACI